ncbi:hypothetical protein [Teredinibacter purpureus]|uniref:hypothetical protein n=1 Tax=Teredinibacter purpureus TaxID=2731756 RepID=UPI0005F82D75|nr:hypothetical protein [Teredinibacter purpureus]
MLNKYKFAVVFCATFIASAAIADCVVQGPYGPITVPSCGTATPTPTPVPTPDPNPEPVPCYVQGPYGIIDISAMNPNCVP